MILGYTVANDVTARDLQRRDGQWARAKGFDTFCPLGPSIMTHLSLDEVVNSSLTTSVDGEVKQDANTADMVFKIPELIAYVSAFTTPLPGDVLLTGTPAGVGPIVAGQRVSVEIEGIGTLTNPVVDDDSDDERSSSPGSRPGRQPTPPPPNVPYSGVRQAGTGDHRALKALGGVLGRAGRLCHRPAVGRLPDPRPDLLLRGLPGSFADYRTSALRFEYIDGMLASHPAIATLIVLTMFVVRKVHQRHPCWLNSVQPGFRWRYALACLLVSAVGLNAVYWLSRGSDAFEWAPGEHFVWWLLVIVLTFCCRRRGRSTSSAATCWAAGAVGRSPWLAVAISGVVFASLHGTQNAPLFVDRLGFGLLAGALVVLTGGSRPPSPRM